ncbi:MBL fold metallo-hydrolase [Nocardioides marmoraquaticus]
MLTEIADGVLVHQSAVLRNNTVVVVGGDGFLVVDAGVTAGEMTCLADDLRERGLSVAAGFSTHPDWDHVLWHPALGHAPRFGTPRCAKVLREARSRPDWQEREAEGLPEEVADDVPLDLFGLVDPLPARATHVPWDGPAVRVVEHPAHSPGHAALVVEESRVLVAGDMLSDVFVPMLDTASADPAGEYASGLAVLNFAAQDVDLAVPGHGSVAHGGDVALRMDRDRAYLHAFERGTSPDDPRLTSPVLGWEWVRGIHEHQVAVLGERQASRGGS